MLLVSLLLRPLLLLLLLLRLLLLLLVLRRVACARSRGRRLEAPAGLLELRVRACALVVGRDGAVWETLANNWRPKTPFA